MKELHCSQEQARVPTMPKRLVMCVDIYIYGQLDTVVANFCHCGHYLSSLQWKHQ